MCERSAIHFTGTAVSARNRRAIATLRACPSARRSKSVSARRRQFSSYKVIGHEAEGLDRSAGFRARLCQGRQKSLAILLLENRLRAVTPIHHVVNRTRIFHAQFARHVPQTIDLTPKCQ